MVAESETQDAVLSKRIDFKVTRRPASSALRVSKIDLEKALGESSFLRLKRSLELVAKNVVFWPAIGQRTSSLAFRSPSISRNNIVILAGASASRQIEASERTMSVWILRSLPTFVLLFIMNFGTYPALVSVCGTQQESLECLIIFLVACLCYPEPDLMPLIDSLSRRSHDRF